MDNIEHIHIAKVPYSIEPKAKLELRKYLADVRANLDEDTADEVMHDIESRIPELLAGHHTKQHDVVTHADVQYVKKQLGEPEQFTSDHEDAAQLFGNKKKLFRDTDEVMLGGVASGIGKYFSIDANIVRVAFFVLTFFYGFGIILYLFLWILLPEARTSADKLIMSGKPVTVSSLQHYRASVSKSLGHGPRLLQKVVQKICRFVSVIFTSLVSLALLSLFGVFSALFYVYPFRTVVSGYGLDYLFLGLTWLGCLSFIGLLVLLTARIWGYASSRLNVAAIALIVVLIMTIAGESASGILIYNHFANKYGGDKSVRTLNVASDASAPTHLVVNSDHNLDLTYAITNQPLHAIYSAYPAMNQPRLTISENKGILTIASNQLSQAAPSCLGNLCQNIYLPVHVTVYGPSLQEYDNLDGGTLTINSGNLGSMVTFIAKGGSTTNINNSYAATMNIISTDEATVNTDNTTTQTANVAVDQTSYVTGPITTTLNATLPDNCSQLNNSSMNLTLAGYPLHASINGQPQTTQELQQNACISSMY